MKSTCKKLLVCLFMWTFVSCSADSYSGAAGTIEEEEVIIDEANFSYNDSELEVIDLINDYRVSIGLNALQSNSYVSQVSEKHNEYMISKKVISHDNFTARAKNIINVVKAKKVGENLAFNYKTSKGAFEAWLKSPVHKQNLDGDYTHCGISISVDSTTGNIYYTNIFVKI